MLLLVLLFFSKFIKISRCLEEFIMFNWLHDFQKTRHKSLLRESGVYYHNTGGTLSLFFSRVPLARIQAENVIFS